MTLNLLLGERRRFSLALEICLTEIDFELVELKLLLLFSAFPVPPDLSDVFLVVKRELVLGVCFVLVFVAGKFSIPLSYLVFLGLL